METDPPMWIACDFECKNVPPESRLENDDSFMKKSFVNKPIAKGYNIAKNTFHENLIL